MARIHGNKVYKLYEFNLLHDILNPPKRTKILNIRCSTILQGCIKTQKGKTMFKIFQILLDSGCISTVIMGRLINKFTPKKTP